MQFLRSIGVALFSVFISQAQELLGWQPTIPLDEGLPRTIDYFRTIVG